jgi:hypothetical protein
VSLQEPEAQATEETLFVEHAVAQPPQLLTSVCSSTHVLPHKT